MKTNISVSQFYEGQQQGLGALIKQRAWAWDSRSVGCWEVLPFPKTMKPRQRQHHHLTQPPHLLCINCQGRSLTNHQTTFFVSVSVLVSAWLHGCKAAASSTGSTGQRWRRKGDERLE